GGSAMKEIFKKKAVKKSRKSANDEVDQSLLEVNLMDSNEQEEEKESISFFVEVLKRLPQKTSTTILNAYGKSKEQAEKILAKSKEQFDSVFDEFLEGV